MQGKEPHPRPLYPLETNSTIDTIGTIDTAGAASVELFLVVLGLIRILGNLIYCLTATSLPLFFVLLEPFPSLPFPSPRGQ